MPFSNMNPDQSFALLEETTSARSLLAYGARVVRTAAFVDTTRDPILTMLSIGFEKLYKLSLGLVFLEENGSWPSKIEMKTYGHNLEVMHSKLLLELEERTVDASQYVRSLLSRVQSDPVVPPLIKALDMYGRSGRFYHLDRLGECGQRWKSPAQYWDDVESAVLKEPEVQALWSAAINTPSVNAHWDDLKLQTNERIAASVENLWEMIAVCGRNHVLGSNGRVFGFEVHPTVVGRQ